MPKRTLSVGVIMDPIGSITPHKDSSLAMLLEAARRGYALRYFVTWCSTAARRREMHDACACIAHPTRGSNSAAAGAWRSGNST